MEFKEVIYRRRSNRFLSDKPLKKEDLDYILEIAQRAPVGMGKYEWTRLVLLEGEALKTVQNEFVKEIGKDVSYGGSALIYILHKGASDTIDNLDGGAIAEHICLAAAEKDIGSVFLWSVTRTKDNKTINDLLQKREEEKIIAAVTLGYKASEEVRDVSHKIEVLKVK